MWLLGPAIKTFFIQEERLGHAQELLGILAQAPGGQMQGDATQAMRCHRRGAATKQMSARRRAPSGCGPQASSKMPSNSCACPKASKHQPDLSGNTR